MLHITNCLFFYLTPARQSWLVFGMIERTRRRNKIQLDLFDWYCTIRAVEIIGWTARLIQFAFLERACVHQLENRMNSTITFTGSSVSSKQKWYTWKHIDGFEVKAKTLYRTVLPRWILHCSNRHKATTISELFELTFVSFHSTHYLRNLLDQRWNGLLLRCSW